MKAFIAKSEYLILASMFSLLTATGYSQDASQAGENARSGILRDIPIIMIVVGIAIAAVSSRMMSSIRIPFTEYDEPGGPLRGVGQRASESQQSYQERLHRDINHMAAGGRAAGWWFLRILGIVILIAGVIWIVVRKFI